MSQLKEIPTFLPNQSIILNKPEEFLKNNFSTGDSRNMEFYNELLQGRLGLLKFDTQALSGAVLLQDQFWKYTGSWYLMFCTPKDIYKYDLSSKKYDVLTPIYTTGLISIGTGAASLIVTGSGGANFTTGAIKTGDYLKIGTGSPYASDTWYEIATKDSDTQLTLVTAPTGITNSTYTIRKCFTGSVTNFWDSITFNDVNLGDVWIATNGVNTPIRYTGSGQVTALTGLPSGFVSAKYVEVFHDRLIFLNTIEAGNQPQRERWSAVANCVSWDPLHLIDHVENGYWITGSLVWNGYHIIFRERDAMVGRWIGGEYIFAYESNSSCSGVWAPNSIVSTQQKIYYYAPDNKFHSWNLITEDDLGEPIFPYSVNFDPNLEQYIFGDIVESRNQIRWFVPYGNPSYMNACIVWDYMNERMYIWEYEQVQALFSIGEYLNVLDLYVDDAFWGELFIDEQEGYWDDRTFLDGAPQTIYGGSDGYVRKADIGYNDDGTDYNRVFESTRMNFGLPNMIKRLFKQQHWLKSDISGMVTIKIKKDDSNSFEALTNTISLVDLTRDIIKKNITWNFHAENFKTRIESTNHFSLLGFINYIFAKGKTGR
jgi:hypothetical protein